MSHLQDNILTIGEVSKMVILNRMMVTVCLYAFRVGMILGAHQGLSEVCSEHLRELLAQGMTKGHHHREKTVEQEKTEKRRESPYRLHIN